MVSVGARPSHLLRSVQPVRIACRPTCAAAAPDSIQGCARVTAASLRSKAVEFSLRQGLQAHVPRRQSIRCAAAEAEAESEGGLQRTLLLGTLFGGWYMFNIWFNIYNKKVLKTFAYPITCTCLQFMVGTVMAALIYGSGVLKKPNVTMSTVKTVLPLAVVHTLGNLMTNLSLGKVAVSFTHTIKAMEPFFSVLLSAIFLGDQPHPLVLLTLLPIVGGVAAASLSEATFNWPGFLAAMGSNVTFQSRNVLSKKFMTSDVKLDNIALFSLITALSSIVCLPVALLAEGFKFTPAAMSQMGIANPHEIMKWAVYAAVCFHSYQQVSYMILQRVSPVTHSVGNCLKRVIVIVASVLVFRNPMSTQNMIGTGVALAGVFAYSQVKRLTGKKAKSS